MAPNGSPARGDRFRMPCLLPGFGKPLEVGAGIRELKWIGGDNVFVPGMERTVVDNACQKPRAQSSDFFTLPISLCGRSSRKCTVRGRLCGASIEAT